MDRAAWIALNRASMAAFFGYLTTRSEGSRLIELDRVVGAVTPAVPDRSVFNSVVYEDAASLVAALDELTRIYEEAGVTAWTVWAPEVDTAATRTLEAAGHRLDAEPRIMGMELGGFQDPGEDGIEWSADGDITTMGRINDVAYDYGEGTFATGVGAVADDLHVYLAHLDGEPAATASSYDSGFDCGIYLVATLPEARGLGLATALMRRAIADGRERGCTTTTLQATEAGRPVYERVGYRDFGAFQMWERRKR